MARSTRAAQPDDAAPPAEQVAEPTPVEEAPPAVPGADAHPAAPEAPAVDEFEARGAVVAAALNGGLPLYAVTIGGNADA